GSVVINEVLAHQDAALEDWIELYNATGADIAIGGWWLSDEGADLQKFQVPAGTVLQAGHYISFNETQHFGVGVIANGFALSEFGEAVYLTAVDDLTGELIGYREVQDFGASDRGVTIGRYTSSTGRVDFVAMAGPTKDGPNSLPLVGPIVINEIMYHPVDEGDEFFELVNVSGDDVPLWLEHADLSVSTWRVDGAVEYTFPEGVTLPAGGYLLLVGIDPAEFRAKYGVPAEVQVFGPYTGLLNNAGESIKLYKPAEPDPGMEVPYVRVDRVQYDDALPWPLAPDGQGPSLQRLVATAYGNDPVNWSAGPDEGTPGRLNGATDVTPPRILAVTTEDGVPNKVTVVFSEPVDPATALDAGRYALDNDVTVTGAAAGANDRTVVLTTTTMSEGPVYHLTVGGVRNLALIEILPGTEVTFSYIDAGSGLKGEYFHWSDVNNMFLESNLALTRTDPGVDFGWGDGAPDPVVGADKFAVRWTGSVKALYTETYTFYTVTDEGARLWVNGQQLVEDWNWHGDTWNSGTVSLVAGEFYDIRMEMFEDGGGATARLLWSSPHQAQQVISAERLYDTTWPGVGSAKAEGASTVALVFTEPMDRDSAQDLANYTVTHAGGELTLTGAALLPDHRTLWLAAATPMTPGVTYTAIVSNVISQSGTSVRDGTESMLIYTAAGTGNVLREYWTGISGNEISLLKADVRYPNNPTGRTYEPLFEAPPGFGDAYGTRMRGYLHPPATGDYTFWIATDDNGELWLSDSEDPAGAVRIAYVPRRVGSRQWYQIAQQQSAPIHLEAGHRYYVEALQKEGGGDDNLAVAWQLPDDTFQGPIPGEHLSPYILVPDKTVSIAATDPDASETGPDSGQFTVTRSGGTAAVDVYYTVTGTARTADMQQYLSGTLHLASGQMSATIDVLPLDDADIEGPETVVLMLVPDSAYAIVMAAAVVTIADNDLVLPTVEIAATDPSAAESGTDPGQFTVTRTGDLVGALTVYYTLGGTAGAGDYTPTLTGQVVIPDGSASAVITITPVDDGEQEPDETLVLTLSADASYTLGATTEATVTILDNELPVVTGVVLNPDPLRTVRSVSDIEPSGIGVDTVRATFSEAVTFTSANVVAEKVFVDESGDVSVTETLSPVVSGSGTTEMTIQFANAWQDVIDTWVRIRLTGGVIDADGHALDGEPRLDSSNLGYIYKATDDLPTGDGTAGGDAVFYVGSLRADMRGFGPFQPNPNGIVDQWDLNGFTSKYTQGDLDADFRGFGPFQPAPNGIVDQWDLNGFTSAYTSALTLGKRLWALPTAPEEMAPGEALSAPLAVGDPVAVFAPETSLVAADATAPLELAPALASAGSEETPAANAASDAADAYTGVLTVASDEALEPAPAVWSPASSQPSTAGEAVDLLAGPALEVVLSA
ncbi:MAG TPA: PA14 domain-containing protein, partial [Phycisphaerae bacterium]|nr:PA14 domain-containing protein [Phycisphaerae bacterium]